MKKHFEEWNKSVDNSKVVNLNRYALNKAAEELYEWFEYLAFQDMSLDNKAEDYEQQVEERANYFKFAFLEVNEKASITMSLEVIGIPQRYLDPDALESLYRIMAIYNERKALL